MRRSLSTICFFLLVALGGAEAQVLRLMTYNIRYDNPSDGPDRWSGRKGKLAAQIEFHRPHILGLQEALFHQVRYLENSLEGYRRIGVGRDDGMNKGEFSAIFYDSTELEVLDSGTFWLSPTPGIPSRGWDAALHRVCSWGQFRLRGSDRQIWVCNTHFDHRGQRARQESARLILKTMISKAGTDAPLVVMGDLNAGPGDLPLQILTSILRDARAICQRPPMGPTGTWNGFDPGSPVGERIDHILVSTHVGVLRYAILSPLIEGRFLSDHFAVVADLGFP